MRHRSWLHVALMLVFMCAAAAVRADIQTGLVARYSFEEGGGNIAHDASGNKHHAKIKGCLFVKGVNGFCMDVNGAGKGQHLNCGDLDLKGEFTLSAWVYAYVWSDKDWSGIVYKSDKTYGMRNKYTDPGRIHFRAGGSDLISSTQLQPKKWHHLAGVFKPGKFMRFYVNGVLDNARGTAPTKLGTDNLPLLIGACARQFFCGRIDEVRIYERALTDAEVKAVFEADGGGQIKLAPSEKELASPAFTFSEVATALRVFPRGGMELVFNGESYRIASSFSAPGKRLNCLSLGKAKTESEDPVWNPSIIQKSDDSCLLVARSEHYLLTRRIRFTAKKITVENTCANQSQKDVGIVLSHQLSTSRPLTDWHLYGQEKAVNAHDGRTPAINPTCFITQGKGSVGFVVEDDVIRNQLEAQVSAPMGTIALGSRHFGLPKGATYTTAFSIYPTSGGHFDFINQVRADWNVPQVTIPGPTACIRVASWSSAKYREEWAPHPEKFRAFLARKNIKVFMVCPWYRYWDGFDFSEEAFKKTCRDAMKTIKAVDPEAKCLACLETYYYFEPRSILKDTVPQAWKEWSKMPYEFGLPAAATAVLDKTAWRDSVWRNPQQNIMASRGDPGPDVNYKTPPLCLLVYPELGNHFFKLRMKEIDYLLDEVGFDGVYMDMFGYGQNYSYDKWDGHTVDISADGEVTRKYSHLALVTAEARRVWLERIVAKGKIALVNFGQPNTKALQRVPYLSFVEGAGIGHRDLESPIPDSSGAAGCQLTTPIALAAGGDKRADKALARVRAFLRYGVVYYHYYSHTMFPEQGEGSGEYGPINHMFPITPVRLGRGFIVGKERIVTTVSCNFLWKQAKRPRILLFDAVGRDKKHTLTAHRTDEGWRIEIKLDDWKDIAVIEE